MCFESVEEMGWFRFSAPNSVRGNNCRLHYEQRYLPPPAAPIGLTGVGESRRKSIRRRRWLSRKEKTIRLAIIVEKITQEKKARPCIIANSSVCLVGVSRDRPRPSPFPRQQQCGKLLKAREIPKGGGVWTRGGGGATGGAWRTPGGGPRCSQGVRQAAHRHTHTHPGARTLHNHKVNAVQVLIAVRPSRGRFRCFVCVRDRWT